MEVLKRYNEVSCYIEKVQLHADNNRKSFGFLSSTAYLELALKHQLWVVPSEDESDVSGYIMFGGVYPRIRIFQLFSNPSFRKRGVATKLIGELIRFGERHDYMTISARVAADLAANAFWEKMCFNVTKQEQGGATQGRTINLRSFSLDTKDLLSGVDSEEKTPINYVEQPILGLPTYAIDLNPLFDITKRREGTLESEIILNQGFSGHINICITPEFKAELIRTTNQFADDPILTIANTLPTLPANSSIEIRKLSHELREIVFPMRSKTGKKANNDNSDLIHLAHCISNSLSGFITREIALLKSSDILKKKYGVKIISPSEITDYRDDLNDVNIASSNNHMVSVKRVDNTYREAISDFLLEFGIPKPSVGNLLNKNLGNDLSEKMAVYIDGLLVGYSSWNKPTKMNNIVELYLYIDEHFSGSTSAIDHILECVVKDTSLVKTTRIDLFLSESQTLSRDTAIKKGFIQNTKTKNLSKISHCGYIDEINWNYFKEEFEHLSGLTLPASLPKTRDLSNTGIPVKRGDNLFYKCLSFFEFETLISPGFLLPKGRQGLLLPIKESYAKSLFGDLRGQLELIPSDEVSFLLERAYFRAKPRSDYFKKGGIVFFYVSGANSIQEIIGMARITYTEVISCDSAIFKLKRQGVLNGEELKEISDKDGKLHAFTFDNFNKFPSRLSFKKAKGMGIISGANLTTVEPIPYNHVIKIVEMVY